MNSGIPGVSVAVLSIFLVGCAPCNSIGCNFGFDVEVVGADGLPDGIFELDLQIEGEQYSLACTVGTVTGPSACSLDQTDGSFTIDASVITADGSPLITVNVVDTGESSGDFLAYRGPETIDVTVGYENELVAAGSYAPEYNRVEHRGAPTCGYCDEPARAERLEVTVGP